MPLLESDELFNYLRANSYRSEKYNIFYVSTPKVACTSLKWWFAALEGKTQILRGITNIDESDPELDIHHIFHQGAPNITGLMPEVISEVLASDSYFRFAMVRNPYRRIFSAWQSKLLLQEPLQIGPYLQCDFLHYPIKSSGDIAVAFEAFLEHLVNNETPSYWDHHWIPQSKLLRPDVINYSKLVKIEDAGQLSKALADRLGAYIPDPFIHRRSNESLIPYLSEFITDRSSELIRTLYAEDFDTFGYDKHLPSEKKTFSVEQFDLAIKAIRLIRGRHQRLGERSLHIKRLNQALSERDETIANLNHIVIECDGQAAHLNHEVIEHDRQVACTNHAAAEYEGEITRFHHAAAEYEGQIACFHHAAAEYEGQIARFHHAAAEYEGQIARFHHAAAEYEEQNAHFHHAMAERDGQFVGLNQELAERDAHAVYLKEQADRIAIASEAEINQLRQQLNQTIHSRSWRLTAPLRKAPRMAFLGKIAGYLRLRSDLFLGSAVRQVRASPFFNSEYYLNSNQDLQNAGVDPAMHYLLHGWREHRDPSASFSTAQYLFDNPDVAQAGVNPLVHYLRSGRKEGRRIGRQGNALEAISSVISAHPFSVPNQDLADAPSVTAEHGAAFNAAIDAQVETIKKSGLFDESFYLSMYTDLQLAPDDAIRHYCDYGWREEKNPSGDFDTGFYLASYNDIRIAGINPFWHYIVAGASESRQVLPEMSARYEDDIWFGDVHTDIKLLAFYSAPNWTLVREGRPMFRGHLQPFFPHDGLGFYGGVDERVLKSQTQMAKHHGLYGFCFEVDTDTDGAASSQSVDLFLAHNDIDFRFCVQIKLCSEDILKSIVVFIVRAVSDRRFIHLKGRPVIIVTVPGEKQQASIALGYLRRRLAEQGVANPFLIGRLASAGEDCLSASLTDMADLCDAVLDLPSAPIPGEAGDFLPLNRNGVDAVPYSVVASHGVTRTRAAQSSAHPVFHCITLGRDDSATETARPLVYTRFHMTDYRRWLDAAIAGAKATHPEDRRFVFVNGWNNWNEGLFLEPDRQAGFCRVNETTRALLGLAPGLQMPKISVIVPNYNHERFLRRRLNSIYGQTYKNIEVILLDDCSSDQSRSVLNQYAAANPEITRTLYNDTNSGSAFRQWAKGIKAATGDLVWIAESDDYCDERFLEVLAGCFVDEAVLLAYSKCVFVARDEIPMVDEFQIYVSDLKCAAKWNGSYVETAHNEVRDALGIKNTIPNASGVLFKRPIDMSLLDDEAWLSMVVAGDWVFYLHIIRGGKIAYSTEATNFFRRYEGSAAEVTYKKEVFYREVGMASRTVAAQYNVPLEVLEQCRDSFGAFYRKMVGRSDDEFALWYDYQSILRVRDARLPNVMVSTMGFFPGGAEILPIRLANEFKRQGLSVLLLSSGLNPREDGVRRMLRNDVPVIETSSVDDVREIIRDFGVEVLNTHQWHIQKYPLQVPDVFDELRGHVASLHGMIEHEDAFGVTEEQLRKADQSVTTWVYTAEKNLVPFSNFGLYDTSSSRFVKMPNGMQPPHIVPIPRAEMGIPESAFALCCVSRAIPDKGWAETILAVERARALSGRDIRLILVGNGPVHDDYCRVGVPDFVHLAGFSANSVGHYAAADMGIMLTKFKSESFPLTIVDCLFAGKPYIASDVGDIRNMLTTLDEVAGEVIALEDWEVPIEKAAQVVAAFASDKQKYLNAAALVPEVANRYRIDVVASQYADLFMSRRDENRLRSSDSRN